MVRAAGSVMVASPAKINLHLSVGPLRADGYHDLATVFQALDLVDELSVAVADELTLETNAKDIPTGPDNLAFRAAALLQDRFDIPWGARMVLSKGIPVAGGMAGGSTDAAAALVGCNSVWGSPATNADLLELAAEVGSDVPFCLHGGTALGSSRGEVLTPVLTTGEFTWVVAASFQELSTPAVYRKFDAMAGDVPPPSVPPDLLVALRSGDREAVGASLHNDLQRPAIALLPELDMLLEAGRDFGALGAMVSGSGPTTVFLARDHEHGLELAVMLSATGLCRATKVATAPAHGTRMVTE
jgi:4-diphosphocytidyl-2-C-methyl-D-erythritol kinase